MSFFSGFTDVLNRSNYYHPPSWSEGIATVLNVCTFGYSISGSGKSIDVIFFILPMMFIILYYIFRAIVLDDQDKYSDKTLNTVYFVASLILFISLCVYDYYTYTKKTINKEKTDNFDINRH